MNLKAIVQTTRGPFLVLTPICVFLGVSVVIASQVSVDMGLLVLALLGALFAHISVNTFNEYFDFKSGLDFNTVKTAFSGGSGALPQYPQIANTVLLVAVVSFIATVLIGCYFIWHSGMGIIPIGVVGLVLIVTYTGWINKYPYICLIAPGLGFGILMVAGTQFVLMGQYSVLSWWAAAIPFFLVNNLLLLNQYPDIKADTAVGRCHMPIAIGTKRSSLIYGAFVLATIVVIVVGIANFVFPLLSLIALLPLPLAFFSLKGAIVHGDAIGSAPQYLAANVVVAIITPLLLGLSIAFGD